MSLTNLRKSSARLFAATCLSCFSPLVFGQYPNQQAPPPYAAEPPRGQEQPQGAQGQGAPEPDVAGPSVARISLINGDVSVRRGDSGDFVAAALNAPLLAQDYVSTGPAAHAEVQLNYSNMVRLGIDTETRFTELDASRAQMQIARGTITYWMRAESPMQIELSTPSVSVRPLQRGSYRISVLDDGQTEITVRAGEAEIATPRGVERIRAGKTMLVRGTSENPEFQIVNAIARDDWDIWNERRDHELDRARSYQYMSRDMEGGEDLDANGRWNNDPQYGNVWTPTVAAGWAPYRVGRWVWEDYYGWTWVSGDPWGWAPYHYGSWYNGSFGWSWCPGPVYSHHFWRPALVAFFGFGGGGFGLNAGIGFGFGNVGWVPLAPFERFHPWYGRGAYGGYGRGSINNVNIVNNTNITNIYRNARVGNGVSGINAQDFASGRFSNTSTVGADQVRQAGLMHGALPVTPTNANLRYSDRQTQAIPRNAGGNSVNSASQGRFFSRNPPTASNRVPFQQQQRAMQQSFGGQGRSFGTQATANTAFPANTRAQTMNPAGNRSWNGFGNPGSRTAEVPRSSQVPSAPRPAASSSAWGRFGSPRNNSAAPAPAHDYNGSRQSGGSGWSRYSNTQPQRNYAAPTYSSPSAPSAAPYSSQPSRGAQNSYSQPSRSLQISQPIVGQRSAPQQYSRPSYSSPAPSYNRGGGGGPAPHSSYSGGGGGGQAPRASYSSGGHSGGDGGGGRRR
ncbi:MAG: FecR domain-containing protein [Acidobacteriota bacterium]|nr:FecR domain-containing protein [Acidobacteriota bacterium]